jgi:peptidoglycan/LPS O-acetylase OafA/YrhL
MGASPTNIPSPADTSSKHSKLQRFESLDALRGIAAIMVVLFHFSLDRTLPYGFNNLKLFDTGVDLFFIISGFVIFMSIGRVKSGRAFMIKRAGRLYPTYWMAVTLTFLLIILIPSANYYSEIKPGISGYLANMTMFQYYLDIPDIDGPYWTLIIEMLFYIWILILFKAQCLKYAAVFGLSLSIFVATGSIFYTDNPFFINLLQTLPLLKYIPLFTAGILFYEISFQQRKVSISLVFMLITFMAQIAMYNHLLTKIFIGRTAYAGMLVIFYLLFGAIAAQRLKFIALKPLLFFGRISYALYLVHQYLSTKIIIPFLMDRCHTPFILACFVAFIVCVAIATAITLVAEVFYTPVKHGFKLFKISKTN